MQATIYHFFSLLLLCIPPLPMRNLKFVQFGDFAILHAAQPLKLQPESEQALILCPFILSLSLPKHTCTHTQTQR